MSEKKIKKVLKKYLIKLDTFEKQVIILEQSKELLITISSNPFSGEAERVADLSLLYFTRKVRELIFENRQADLVRV